MNSTRPTTSPIRTTPIRKTNTSKNVTPICKPERRFITPKIFLPKHVTSPIHLYVISDAGKLVKPHSPREPPPPLPPLPSKVNPIFKRPVCKNPKI